MSVREIAAKIGMTGPTLLHHFGPKDEMFLHLGGYMANKQSEYFVEAAKNAENAAEALRNLWAMHAEESARREIYAVFELISRWRNLPFEYLSRVERGNERRRSRLRELIEQDGVPVEESDRIAAVLGGGYRGLILDSVMSDDPARLEEALETLLSWYESLYLPSLTETL